MCLRMARSLMALWHSGAGRKHLLQIRMALKCFRNSALNPARVPMPIQQRSPALTAQKQHPMSQTTASVKPCSLGSLLL